MNTKLHIEINQRSFVKNGTLGHSRGVLLTPKDRADLIEEFKMNLPTHVKLDCLPRLSERMQNTLVFVQENNICDVKFMSSFHKDQEKSYAKLYYDNHYIKPEKYFDEGIEKDLLIYDEDTFYIYYSRIENNFKMIFDYFINNNQSLSFESKLFSLGDLH